jgi:hypothetical protein
MHFSHLPANPLQRIRILIVLFIAGLILSGLSAFPIKTQLEIAHDFIQQQQWNNAFTEWIEKVHVGVSDTDARYPFIAYGTDWLAFAHLVIAIAFIGPLRDPVRNIWVIQFGIIACILIFPLALIAGEIRGIPLFWRMIDCSFGVIGGVLLWCCYRMTKKLSISSVR